MDDDLHVMDEVASETDPTARGIVQCLRMLAEEAAAIRLPRTLEALRQALEVCAQEGIVTDDRIFPDEMGVPPGIVLH